MAHAGGRPTKLNGHVIDHAREYVDGYSSDAVTAAITYLQNCGDKLAPRNKEEVVPTIDGLAYHLRISRDTLYAWAEANTDFAYIVERLQQKQVVKVVNGTILGKYKSPKTAGMLLAKQGYYEKQVTDNTVKNQVSFVNDVPRPGNDAAD